MTVGLPGAGVGGIFYLLSALSMPVHALIRQVAISGGAPGNEERPRWGLVWRQFATALGIIAGLWLTGWALAAYLIAHPEALGSLQTAAIGKRLPNVLKVGAVIVSLTTLFGVFGVVQLARLVVRSGKPLALPMAEAKRAAALILVIGGMAMIPARLGSQPPDSLQDRIATGNRAWAAGDTALARREFEAALEIDPAQPRALYRLGEINRARPRVSRELFERYTRVEPADAWGWIALGDAYAREGRIGHALESYAAASRIAPGERDVNVGRARVLAASGRTDAAIAEYERWTAQNPRDSEALRELGDQRRRAGQFRGAARAYAASNEASPDSRTLNRMRYAMGFAAPWAEVNGGGTHDSDENESARAGAAIGIALGDRVRAVAAGSRRWISGPIGVIPAELTVDEASAGIEARPLASLRVEVKGGAAIPRGDLLDDESAVVTGIARGTWRQPGGRGSLDLRATRMLLDATPLLVTNRVTRTEAGGRADIPVIRRISIRAGGKSAAYSSSIDDNTRTSLLGGVAVQATRAAEVSAIFQRITFERQSFAGYFSPRLARIAEVGTYAELESDAGVVLALDAGAGAVALSEFGAAAGGWEPSYRLFASLLVPVRAGSALNIELDSYDSRLADAATTTSWRFISLAASLRLALR